MSAADRLDQIEARAQAAVQALMSGTTGTPPNIDGLSTDDALGILGDAAADVPALVLAVRAVLAAHFKVERRGQALTGWNAACWVECVECHKGWPCPTVQAVEAALGGERA